MYGQLLTCLKYVMYIYQLAGKWSFQNTLCLALILSLPVTRRNVCMRWNVPNYLCVGVQDPRVSGFHFIGDILFQRQPLVDGLLFKSALNGDETRRVNPLKYL